jgi:hypothetical protein
MKTDHDLKPAPTPEDASDRRRFLRYRFTQPMTIRLEDGSRMPALSVETSAGGMSAMASGSLKVGQKVQLEPVGGGRAWALVRHKLGELYGFEFLELTAEQLRYIEESCKKRGIYRQRARIPTANVRR